jgi:hypothetical protein
MNINFVEVSMKAGMKMNDVDRYQYAIIALFIPSYYFTSYPIKLSLIVGFDIG